MRLINEDDVLEIIERVTNEAVEKKQPKYLIQPRIIAEIAGLPTLEAQPVKHGRWERRSSKIYACSECTNEVTDRQKQNYSFCPFCGYLMDGDSDA